METRPERLTLDRYKITGNMKIGGMKRGGLLPLLCLLAAATTLGPAQAQQRDRGRLPVVFDTDANNELDDQHALAYLLFNRAAFSVAGVTVNATYNGGAIDAHYAEAGRIIRLCGGARTVPLLKGANGNFGQLRDSTGLPRFDGHAAVDFIIRQARRATRQQPLVVLAVGKLTNVALALKKAPAIAPRLRVVWLGSNYPEPGEYNQDNDTAALNFVLNSTVPFELVTVRYGKPSGTDAVKVTQEEINRHMPGSGPRVAVPVPGRHGAAFDRFGDYSVNLFQHIAYYGNPPSRALFDMAAVAIVKNPAWAQARKVPAPLLVQNRWEERPGNPREITVWEHFDRDGIIRDFFLTIQRAGTRP